MIFLAIQSYASSKPNKREVAEELTNAYNKAVDYLKQESEIDSWVNAGDSSQIVRTRLKHLLARDREYDSNI